MKKTLISILFSILLICALTSCSKNKNQNNPQPQEQSQTQVSNETEKVVSNFLKDLQHQNYASAKQYYVENLDNMANFHNQIETISPNVTNKFFSKLADFMYTIESSSISKDNPSKAIVYVTMEYYDVGKAFETTVLEYIKNEISMTYDGKNDDDIVKKADEIIIENIESSHKTTVTHLPISLTFDQDTWKVEKMSNNPELLNVLSGNILETINKLISTLEQNS